MPINRLIRLKEVYTTADHYALRKLPRIGKPTRSVRGCQIRFGPKGVKWSFGESRRRAVGGEERIKKKKEGNFPQSVVICPVVTESWEKVI